MTRVPNAQWTQILAIVSSSQSISRRPWCNLIVYHDQQINDSRPRWDKMVLKANTMVI